MRNVIKIIISFMMDWFFEIDSFFREERPPAKQWQPARHDQNTIIRQGNRLTESVKKTADSAISIKTADFVDLLNHNHLINKAESPATGSALATQSRLPERKRKSASVVECNFPKKVKFESEGYLFLVKKIVSIKTC